jgi:hypothetical protein
MKTLSWVPSRPLRFFLFAVGALALIGATTNDLASSAPAPSLRLLSASQYTNIVHSIFGTDIAIKVRFAPVKRTDGLVSVGSSKAVITPGALDPLDSAARSVAQQVIAPERRAFLIPCKPAATNAPDDKCTRLFLSRVGRLLYRRPRTS